MPGPPFGLPWRMGIAGDNRPRMCGGILTFIRAAAGHPDAFIVPPFTMHPCSAILPGWMLRYALAWSRIQPCMRSRDRVRDNAGSEKRDIDATGAARKNS